MHRQTRRPSRGRTTLRHPWVGIGSLLVLAGGMVALPNARSPLAEGPRQCITLVDSLRAQARRSFERDQKDSASSAYSKYTRSLQEAYERAKACAARFTVATVPDSLLADLADLYMVTGQTDLARAAIDAILERGTPETRLDRVITALGFYSANPTERTNLDSLAREVTQSPAATPRQRLAATGFLWKAMSTTAAPYPDTCRRIVQLGTAILEEAAVLDSAALAPYSRIVANVPRRLARAYADLGLVDSGVAVLQSLKKKTDQPFVTQAIDREIEGYRLIGTPATPLDPDAWLNSPPEGDQLELKGQTTVLMFVAHYCGHCGYTYPLLSAILDDYQKQNVRLIMVTKTFGFFGEKEGLSFGEELTENQEFYLRRHGVTVPIAVYKGQPVKSKERYTSSVRHEIERKYGVYDYGNATFVVIDSLGIIQNVRNDAYGAIARSNTDGAIASARERARK